MALVNVTGTLVLPDGTGLADRQLIIRKVHRKAEPDTSFVIMPGDVVTQTDASGAVDVDLYDGQYVVIYQKDYNVIEYAYWAIPDDGSVSVNVADITPVPIPKGATNVYRTKRGDTIKFGCIYLNAYGVRDSLDGITVTAAMERLVGGERYDFTVTIVDEAAGRFDIVMGQSIASTLVPGEYAFDIKFTNGVDVGHTNTARIIVEKEIT